MEQNFNRSNIRTYFKGKSQLLTLIIFIVGICTAAFGVGFILIIAAIVLWVKNVFFSDYTHEDDVDKAMQYEFEQCKTRALEKLGLVKEQVSVIEPIFITGQSGYAPVTATNVINASEMSKGLLRRFLGRKEHKKALSENSDDPMDLVKIGSDDNLRYTLLHNSALYFGEDQLYIYYENVDIATGLVYASGTMEYFYNEIEAISTSQEKTKQFNPKKKKFVRYIRENFTISLAGTSYTGAFKAVIENGENNNVNDNQLMAMRNLVRDKKMSVR